MQEPEDAVELLKHVSFQMTSKFTVAEALEFQPPALVAAASYEQKVVRNGCRNYSWTQTL